MKRIALFLLLFLLPLTLSAAAADGEAANISARCAADANGQTLWCGSRQKDTFYLPATKSETVITVRCEEPVAGVYLRFDQKAPSAPPLPWSLTADGETISCGEDGYLHQYVGDFAARELTLTFPAAMPPCVIRFLSEGALPDWVQVWEPILERADVLLLPTHADDDQLYFAGVIPWCLGHGASIQVAYLVEHYNSMQRMNELLDGLWACGLRHYPVLGLFYDMGNVDYHTTLSFYRGREIQWEDFEAYQTELMRRFKPQVVVTHSLTGEYGHGAHILNCESALAAVQLTADATAYPASAERWGVWDVPKLYVHNYTNGRVFLDLDSPLESFDGMSPFQLARNGLLCHVSQLQWYRDFLFGYNSAAEIPSYNPCEYGLYRSTVGADENGDSFFDHITLYAEQERLAAQAESARLAAEAEAKLARQAQEARRADAERQAAELAAKEAAERAALEAAAGAAAQRQRLLLLLITLASLIIVSALTAAIVLQIRDGRKKKRNG